jgi:ABC-2 type transport system permease protein
MSRVLRIAWREYVSYVKTVGFWLSLCAMPLLIVGVTALPTLIERSTPPSRLAIVDLSGQGLGAGLRAALVEESGHGGATPLVVVPPIPAAANGVDASAAGAAFRADLAGPAPHMEQAAVISRKAGRVNIDLWTQNLADQGFEARLRDGLAQAMRRQHLVDAGVAPQVLAAADSLEPTISVYSPRAAADHGRVGFRDRLPALIGFAMGFLLWSMVLTGAQILLISVIEEKSTKILEVLLSSASPAEIMFGKILGAGGITLSVLGVWGSLGSVLLAFAAPAMGADLWSALFGHALIAYFALYLLGGYLMYASVFVSIGAFCETPRDAQTLLAPVMVILTVPLVFMAQSIRHPDAPILAALSWFPPFTPFLMIARVANAPSPLKIAGSLAVIAVTTTIVVWISGRAFRAGALSSGRVDWRGLVTRMTGQAG